MANPRWLSDQGILLIDPRVYANRQLAIQNENNLRYLAILQPLGWQNFAAPLAWSNVLGGLANLDEILVCFCFGDEGFST